MRILAKAAWLAVAAALCVQPARSQTPLRGAIEGDVVDASTGRGISGARVRIQSGQDDPMFTSTDEQGHFQFAGLEFKSYQLDARYPGFISSTGAAGVSAREMVHLVRNGPNGQVRLDMQRYAAIVGKVIGMAGFLRGRVRWVLIFWMFVISAIAYLDRVNISIAGHFIQEEFHLSNVQLGWVFSAFVLGYALFQAPGGRLADRFGPRRILLLAAVWWAIFTSLTALVPATIDRKSTRL